MEKEGKGNQKEGEDEMLEERSRREEGLKMLDVDVEGKVEYIRRRKRLLIRQSKGKKGNEWKRSRRRRREGKLRKVYEKNGTGKEGIEGRV